MQQRAAIAMGVVALCAMGTPALAVPTAYDTAFVEAFEAACVPGRLSYEASKGAALAAGWTEVSRDVHPELAALLEMSEKAALAPELQAAYQMTVYGKDIEGRPHHLVVARTSAVITEGSDPFVQVGCYLYNLDATAPLDPEAVTTLIGQPVSATREEGGAISHIWGPPCPMPRTGDTYLSFVAEGSEVAATMPFTGIALNFTTSELPAGEPAPDPYC